MGGKFLYLTVDVLTILFPFAFSFHPISNFYKTWKALLPAIALPAAIFITWDIWFTSMGVWGFNPDYITGIYFFNLPIEEVLFFICVPYACVFTYDSVNRLTKREKISHDMAKSASDILIVALIIAGGVYHNHYYTSVTFIATGLFIAYLSRVAKVTFLGRFYYAFIFILIPFFIVNGILTGSGLPQPVVWYKNLETMRIRIGTIPFEDVFYGMLLLIMNVSLYEYFKKKAPLRSAGAEQGGA